ncbi:MAG TPA: C1 family peptidase [Saprospiraceae bacterium]|nr:C1 family peptidase [Saprospiraceae bacterium]HMP25030.1 C1 family peptidase [Saprospiraceae bacterium]
MLKRIGIWIGMMACLAINVSAQQRSTGLLFDDEAYEAVPLKKPVLKRNYENLPANASLKAWCPQPQDQGAYANCVGWAAGYAGRTILEALQSKSDNKVAITERAFSPDFLYLLNKSAADANCQRGISINQALKTMQEKGVPRRQEFAASCNPNVPASILAKAQPNRIEGFTRLFDKETPDDFRIKIIKKSLAQQKPVIVGVECYESFKKAGEYWEGAKDKFVGGHALCIIGYDEQRAAFEVMNSWGTDWGNQGFTWIRYQDFSSIVKYAFELITSSPNNTQASISDLVEKTLSGSLDIVLASGEKVGITIAKMERGIKAVKVAPVKGVNYQTAKGYPSETRYRLYFTNEEPAYVYVLGSDLTGAVGQVFPPDAHTSAYLSYPGNAIALPDETWYIEMDNTVGTDFIGIVYSLQALNMEMMVEKMNKTTGTFPEKLQTILGDRLIPNEAITYRTDRIGFQAKSTGHTALATIIAMEHTAKQ